MSEHHYRTTLSWNGSTGSGYRDYDRAHGVAAAPAASSLALSADARFRGDPQLLNPEQLVVAAVSSCQLLSFLGAAARAGLDIRGYRDEATARLDVAGEPARLRDFILRPVIEVAPGTDPAAVHAAVLLAHEQCYIANSLIAPVAIAASVIEA